MGCCSSKDAEEPEDGSPRYSEIGAHCLQSSNAHIQMHACAAGYFSCVTTQQLVASDANEQYVLFAMGSSTDAAALAIRMQSLQQVHATWICMYPHHTVLYCQERAFT
ncbi:hypothetical protein CVIRNUC_005456 [Coccomyxa viridis]|uniref:Uncharacterized protein n=1 Tax=Coccomyxa viridis TaxID=1274662 RepID=A0AAV1I8W2_9CHLO|nr:hypothetical protein CVIRNUC_005456 [Coccomyxa viridis]